MIVLGLHLFHDASMALFVDGELVDFVEMERMRREKHARYLTSREIVRFLADNHLSLADIDVCTIVWGENDAPMLMVDWYGDLEIETGSNDRVVSYQDYVMAGHPAISLPDGTHPQRLFYVSAITPYIDPRNYASSYEHIAAKAVFTDKLINRMVKQIRFGIDGNFAKATFFVSHHAAHARYVVACSPFRVALVVSVDGLVGNSFTGGGIYFYIGHSLYPQVAHASPTGSIYSFFGSLLGFEDLSGPGKLMGLSAYGLPVFCDDAYVGTLTELSNHGLVDLDRGGVTPLFRQRFLQNIQNMTGQSMAQLQQQLLAWDMWSYPPALQANIAASVQEMFRRNIVKLVDSAVRFAKRVGLTYEGICLTGGAFLNCPTNSFLYARYRRLFIPPAINDEGTALGAAMMFIAKPKLPAHLAYLGRSHDVASFVNQELPAYLDRLQMIGSGEEAVLPQLAALLREGAVCGFYHGRSEVGPRALGHRSILARADDCQMAARVNRIKDREPWRPFAPILTAEMAAHYYLDVPADSYYMLFNATVKNLCLPAVTHVDGTSRLQIATEACGPVYRLLKQYGQLCGMEILLNTSFNGRGEPIVETPRDAVESFLRLPLDYLYLDGYLLARRTV
ncbi:MAG: hypothetical protein HQM06_06650 [Magnetococcales bacterium]|nr:hypothetical protein [Magnetococcales bacterium]